MQSWHPDGISVSWYVFDRGCRAPLSRLLHRRHKLALADATSPMKALTDWTLDSACADHDVQNGLCKGCCAGHATLDPLFRSIFKGIRSVRDTFDKLMETLPDWIKCLQVLDKRRSTISEKPI